MRDVKMEGEQCPGEEYADDKNGKDLTSLNVPKTGGHSQQGADKRKGRVRCVKGEKCEI